MDMRLSTPVIIALIGLGQKAITMAIRKYKKEN